MSSSVAFIHFSPFVTEAGTRIDQIPVSYEVFGLPLGEAPVVLVNHALTGNSDLASAEKGWWKTLIGPGKLIDTTVYSVIGFNIPGNGYDGMLWENYAQFTARDIARVFLQALELLNVVELHAAIGGSLGGGIAWEMAALAPDFIRFLIPVASDWKATDWIIGHNYVQQKILENSKSPLQDARMMAMLFYRTPASLEQKFNRSLTAGGDVFNVSSWLQHHGEKLEGRFQLEAYQLMNHLLSTVDVSRGRESFAKAIGSISSTVVQVAVNSDLFFPAVENEKTKVELCRLGIANHFYVIESLHGHDAFLIEHEQLTKFLTPFFNTNSTADQDLKGKQELPASQLPQTK